MSLTSFYIISKFQFTPVKQEKTCKAQMLFQKKPMFVFAQKYVLKNAKTQNMLVSVFLSGFHARHPRQALLRSQDDIPTPDTACEEMCPGLNAIKKIRRIRGKRCQDNSCRALNETANFTKTANFKKITKIAKIRRIRRKRCQDSSWRALDETANITRFKKMTKIAKIRRIHEKSYQDSTWRALDETANFTKITNIAKIRRMRKKRCQDSSWKALDETANFTNIAKF